MNQTQIRSNQSPLPQKACPESQPEIKAVVSHDDLKKFVDLPYHLYRRDPNWVPPLRSEQWKLFDPKRNPLLEHCRYQFFLLKKGANVIGRISAFIDDLALTTWGEPIGLFGSYECIDDPVASRMLLDTARSWLQARGMKKMRGPWNFTSQEWGLVYEGFTPPPVILAPFNPEYYNQQLSDFGLKKIKDLLVHYIDFEEDYQIPPKYLTATEAVEKRYQVRVRQVNLKRLEEDIVTVVRLTNRSIERLWGFYPITDAEGRAMARDLKQILDPKGLLIAENQSGEPIGFALAFPDLNTILRGLDGRLLPFGWLKLIWGLPKIRQYRMFGLGVVPEYQGKAVDSLIYRRLYESLAPKKVRIEINFTLEDNAHINNAVTRLGAKPLRRYRVYEKGI